MQSAGKMMVSMGFTMKTEIEYTLDQLHNRLDTIYGHRLSKVLLYGSQARGDAEPDSDIDVLVVLKGDVSPCEEIDRTIKDIADVSLANDVVVACVFASEDQFENEQSPLLINVRREGIVYEPGTAGLAITSAE